MASVQDIFNQLALGESVKVMAPTVADRKYLYKLLHEKKGQHNRDMSVLGLDEAMIHGTVSVVDAKDGTGAAIVSVVTRAAGKKQWTILSEDDHADVSGNLGEA